MTATAIQPEPDITIREIEQELLKLESKWARGVELRELGTLFAILKVGHSFNRLARFTQYPTRFLMALLDELRGRQLLITNLSPTFVLTQCPGSEELIAIVTGARRFARPELPKPKLALVAPDPKPEEPMPNSEPEEPKITDPANCWCGRPAKHRGVHKGQVKEASLKRKAAKPATRRAAKVARVKSPPAVAEKRAAKLPVASGVTQRSEKTITIGGGRLTLIVDVNLLELRGKDREFVFGLIDQVQARDGK